MTLIYSGWGIKKTLVGECKDGIIYQGWGFSQEMIGTYREGIVYRGFGLNREIAGTYESGSIYAGWGFSKDLIGSYESGCIYSGWGIGKDMVGTYEGEEPGAAAAAFLLMLRDADLSSSKKTGSASDSYDKRSEDLHDTFESDPDDTGGTTPPIPPARAFAIVVFVIAALIAAIVFIIRFNKKDKEQTANTAKYKGFETVYFGRYEQDGDYYNGDEDIEWLVLDRKGDQILVISKYCLENLYYDENAWGLSHYSDWETSTIRAWLNDFFYNTAFTDKERESIVLTNVSAGSRSSGGLNDTEDYLFLLSSSEVKQYFTNKADLHARQTEAASLKGGGGNSTEYAEWWLRITHGATRQGPTVTNTGSVQDPGYQETHSLKLSVRPAMWVKKSDVVSADDASVDHAYNPD